MARAATPFSLEDPVHRGALLELWRLAFGCEFGSTADDTSGDFADGTAAAASGNESSGVANSGGNSAYGTAGGSIKHRRWRDLGWQQDDPTTDFRAAGFFGLHNLLHLATRHPQAFTTLMLKSNGTRADFEYPFAAAGINLTVMLLEVIGLSGAVRDEKGRRSGAAGASAPLRMAQATQPAPAPAATSGLQASKPAAMNVAGNAAGGAAAGAAAGQGEAPPLQLKSTPAARGYVRLMTNYSSGHEVRRGAVVYVVVCFDLGSFWCTKAHAEQIVLPSLRWCVPPAVISPFLHLTIYYTPLTPHTPIVVVAEPAARRLLRSSTACPSKC